MDRIKLSVVLILAAVALAPQAVLALPMWGSGKPQDNVGHPGNPSSSTSYPPPPGPPPEPYYYPFSDPDHYVQGSPAQGSSAVGVSGTYVPVDPHQDENPTLGSPGVWPMVPETYFPDHPALHSTGMMGSSDPGTLAYLPHQSGNPTMTFGSSGMGPRVPGTHVQNVPLSSTGMMGSSVPATWQLPHQYVSGSPGMGSGVPGTNVQQHPTLGSTGPGMMGPRVPPATTYVPPHRIPAQLEGHPGIGPRIPSPEMYVPQHPTQDSTGVMGSRVPWTNIPHNPRPSTQGNTGMMGQMAPGSSGTYDHHHPIQGNTGTIMGHGVPAGGSPGTYDHHNFFQGSMMEHGVPGGLGTYGNTDMSVPVHDPFSDPYHYVQRSPTQGGSTSSTGVTGMGVHEPYIPFSHPSPDHSQGMGVPPLYLPEVGRPRSPSSSPVVPSSHTPVPKITGKKTKITGKKTKITGKKAKITGKRSDGDIVRGRTANANDGKLRPFPCLKGCSDVAFPKKFNLERHYRSGYHTEKADKDCEVYFCLH